MDSIDILTGQHVTIKYQPANIVQRMLALLLDFLFMTTYLTALFFIYDTLLDIDLFEGDTISIVIFGIFSLPVLCYFVFFESILNGQTPGKIILKIRVTNTDGSTPSFISYFLRWLLFPIDMIPYGGLGALLIVFSKNHQRLGDLAAGTTVVKLNSASQKYDLDDLLADFDTDYQPVFPEAEMLTEGQIRLIANLLEDPSSESKVEDSIEQLADKIKEKLNVKSDMGNRTFLQTIVRDYTYYASHGI